MNPVACAVVVVLIIVFVYYTWRAPAASGHWDLAHYDNSAAAGALMTRLNDAMMRLMRSLRVKYHIDQTDDVIASEGAVHSHIVAHGGDTYRIVDTLLDNYNPEKFHENDPRSHNGTSYTLEKGNRGVWIGLRDSDNPRRLIDYNTLMFVMLHESSHMANYKTYGHDQQFWETFKFVLHEAVIAGVYRPVDYERHPVKYMTMQVDYQPLYDTRLRSLWML